MDEILEYLKSDNWDYYPFGTVQYKVLNKFEVDKLIEEIENLQNNLILTNSLRMYYKARYKELKEVKK